jgi:hypothetical protein
MIMPEDIIRLIQENVIQGRMTKDDEGIDEEMVGQPGVTELVEKALASGLSNLKRGNILFLIC